MTSANSPSTPSLLVACLCAQWCGTCRDYRPLFEGMQAHFEGRARFVWVDIEDQSDLVGPVEVENFPALLMAKGSELRFFGTVLPHLSTLEQTVDRAIRGPLMLIHDPALTELLERLSPGGVG